MDRDKLSCCHLSLTSSHLLQFLLLNHMRLLGCNGPRFMKATKPRTHVIMPSQTVRLNDEHAFVNSLLSQIGQNTLNSKFVNVFPRGSHVDAVRLINRLHVLHPLREEHQEPCRGPTSFLRPFLFVVMRFLGAFRPLRFKLLWTLRHVC